MKRKAPSETVGLSFWRIKARKEFLKSSNFRKKIPVFVEIRKIRKEHFPVISFPYLYKLAIEGENAKISVNYRIAKKCINSVFENHYFSEKKKGTNCAYKNAAVRN